MKHISQYQPKANPLAPLLLGLGIAAIIVLASALSLISATNVAAQQNSFQGQNSFGLPGLLFKPNCAEGPRGSICNNTSPPVRPNCSQLTCGPGSRCFQGLDGARCLPVDPTPEPTLTCDNVDCKPGYRCVEWPSGPQCVPRTKPGVCYCFGRPCACGVQTLPPKPTCETVRCAPGSRCVNSNTGPRCVPAPDPTICDCFGRPCVCGISSPPTTPSFGGFGQLTSPGLPQIGQQIRGTFSGFPSSN